MLEKTFSLRGYVVEMFDNGFDDETIVPALVRRAETNLSLREALLTIGAKQAVRTYFADERADATVIRGARSENRRGSKEASASMTKEERDERQATKENRRSLIDTYTLWGHTALRDAKADDLRVSIANRAAQVAGGQKAIRFEKAILAQMPENKTCGQVFSSAKIDKLWMQHYGR